MPPVHNKWNALHNWLAARWVSQLIIGLALRLQAVGKVSSAARGLCLWVRAMESYGTTAKDIAPKRARLQTAQDQLAKKQAALAKAQAKLQEVLAQVASLRVCSIPHHASTCQALLQLTAWHCRGVLDAPIHTLYLEYSV